MTLGLLFPGQGSQHVGMGKPLVDDHPEIGALFREADDVLGVPLTKYMWEGPEETLTETRNAQPAILLHSVAVHRLTGDRIGTPAMAAGHSLGEFSAHVAAGTLSFVDALKAVRLRGELMFDTGTERPGTMAAVLGLDDEAVTEVCSSVSREDSVVVPANFNSGGQVVVSGDVDAVGRAMDALKEAGAKKVVELKVSGAFHSPLMKEAEEGLRAGLEATEFGDPAFPVVSNVTAEPVTDGRTARELLVKQLTSPVRWTASITAMTDAGVDRFLELGPGKILTGLNRRNARGVPTDPLGTTEDIESRLSAEEGA